MDSLFDLFPQESVPQPRPPRQSRRRSSGGTTTAGLLGGAMDLEYYAKEGKKRNPTAVDVPKIRHLHSLICEGNCFDPLVFEFGNKDSNSEEDTDDASRIFRGGKRGRDRRGSVQRHLDSAAMSTLSAGEIKNMKNERKVKQQDGQSAKDKADTLAMSKNSKSRDKRRKRHSLSDEMDAAAAAVAKGATASRSRLRGKFLQEFITMTRFEETQLSKLANGFKVHGGMDGLIDGTGFITVLTYFFERILVEVNPESMERGFLEHMFEVFDDVDKDGMIDFREFSIALAGQLGCSLRRKVKVLFNVYDLDNDGAITIHELCDIIHKGHDATWELVDYTENFFELMDEDGDGEITWQEFRGAVMREPLVLESFSRCLPPGIVDGDLDRKALKMLFVRLQLNWRMLKEICMTLKDASIEYHDREAERLAALRKEIALMKAEEEKKSARDWKKRVSLVGGGFGMKITDDILDGDAAVTLVEFEDEKDANAPSSVDSEEAEDAVRTALKSRYMLDVESFQNAMFKFLLPPQPGDGQLVRHVFSIFSMPTLEVDEDGKLNSKQQDGTNFEGAQLGVSPASMLGFGDGPGEGDFEADAAGDRQFSSKLDIEGIPVVEDYWCDCRELVVFLSSMLLVQHMGFSSEAVEKAAFYFGMYDIDGDGSLSRSEIYEIMSHSHGELGKRILKVHQTLTSMDTDGDGTISFDEYLAAAEKDAWLEELLSMNL